MYSCLFLCRTLTYAQKTEKLLGHNGIAAGIIRPPSGLGGSSCSYAVRVAPDLFREALSILRRYNLPPARAFTSDKSGNYREERL